MDRCLDSVTPRVSPAMNFIMLNEYIEDEVDKALAQMQPLKAPVLMGMEYVFTRNIGALLDERYNRLSLTS